MISAKPDANSTVNGATLMILPFGHKTFASDIRFLIALVAVGSALLGAAPTATAARTHTCAPDNTYWDNIHVHGITCRQAVRLHQEKLARCTRPQRHVTRTAYVYTCHFGPWGATERVARHGFSDKVYIGRNHGRVWMRYDAAP